MNYLDPVKNFALGLVLTAPSPTTSGTSLVLASGDGANFPQPSTDGAFNVVIFPAGQTPSISNSEIVRVTARSTDTLTITRQQESTSARDVQVGDQVALVPTGKLVTDVDNQLDLFLALSGGSRLYIDHDWDSAAGDGNTSQDIAVSFNITFDAAPIVLATQLGAKTTGTKPTAITDLTESFTNEVGIMALNISTTGFTLRRNRPTIFGTGVYYGFSWIAIGTYTP